ncbi:MAG: tRNA (adenosine(37)-N6)-threonylcarbamoyltransferase complex ATPase subunit type 1 TsaE [Alphaproteobacteria bacterium]|nr:tRNA (adenosine(37)-N6)-threonylcarbamoyltransferase complex ATPase subunit type 1 TsaE [Alphaproteobacteria bacterium]
MTAAPAALLRSSRILASEAETAAFAARLAALAKPGDVLALQGDLGAGKTTFARAFIAALSGGPVEVPSPTFTLVQVYETPAGSVWHFDFYRIGSAEEVHELGFDEALAEGISLIEWPERLGGLLPPEALRIELRAAGAPGRRELHIEAPPAWQARLAAADDAAARVGALDGFLRVAGWAVAERRPLSGDASFRRYERLRRADGTRAVLMDAPPPREDVRPFIRVAEILAGFGYSVPAILARDVEHGFLLLEDLGDDLFARLLAGGRGDEPELYGAAVDLLADLHRHAPPAGLPDYGPEELAAAPGNVVEWYLPAFSGQKTPSDLVAEFAGLWREALAPLAGLPRVMVLRDYHAENLIWLPGRKGLARVGLLDFQDAARGLAPYDLVSLLQDARRDVAPELEALMIERYLARRPGEGDAFRAAYALTGAARNSRILGLWPRLWKRDGKPQYMRLLPRTWRLLERDLAHPALEGLRRWYDRVLPPAGRGLPFPGQPA